jgi:nucleotide-binding universal stress UspA family protein
MAEIVPTSIRFENILLATDFSSCSETLVHYGRSLAKLYGSTLWLAHVIAPEGIGRTLTDLVRDKAQKHMEQLQGSEQLKDVRSKAIVEVGETWDVLGRIIEREHIDLIIVGTHGRTGLKKLVLGSVAEKIFRHSPCPVLSIGPKVSATKEAAKINHVLLTTDRKAETTGPAVYAVAIAMEHKAHLTVLHVVEGNSNIPSRQKLLDLLRWQAAEGGIRLQDLVPPPEPMVIAGDAAEQILATAVTQNADLLVMGTHRARAMTTHLMDVAYRVVCEAPCPVLTVSAEYKMP